MKTLHTPAPWQVDYSGNCHIGITDKNERTIAFCNLQNEDGDEDEANARLIAAAPDLLNALKALMQRSTKDAEHYAPDGNEPIWAFISDASDAIAKADGR
jgi:hypothetical protein